MKNRVVNSLYALVYQFMFVPLLGFFTYYVYDRVIYLDVIANSIIAQFILIFGLIVFNIICVYGLAYLFKKFYKFELIYYVILGLVVSFIGIWLKVYYYAIENIQCSGIYNTDCLKATCDDRSFTAMLVFVVAYYLLFLAMFRMVEKKFRIEDKDKKVSKKTGKKKKKQ